MLSIFSLIILLTSCHATKFRDSGVQEHVLGFKDQKKVDLSSKSKLNRSKLDEAIAKRDQLKAEFEAKKDKLEEEIRKLEEKKKAAEKKQKNRNQTRADLKAQIAELKKNIEDAQTKLIAALRNPEKIVKEDDFSVQLEKVQSDVKNLEELKSFLNRKEEHFLGINTKLKKIEEKLAHVNKSRNKKAALLRIKLLALEEQLAIKKAAATELSQAQQSLQDKRDELRILKEQKGKELEALNKILAGLQFEIENETSKKKRNLALKKLKGEIETNTKIKGELLNKLEDLQKANDNLSRDIEKAKTSGEYRKAVEKEKKFDENAAEILSLNQTIGELNAKEKSLSINIAKAKEFEKERSSEEQIKLLDDIELRIERFYKPLLVKMKNSTTGEARDQRDIVANIIYRVGRLKVCRDLLESRNSLSSEARNFLLQIRRIRNHIDSKKVRALSKKLNGETRNPIDYTDIENDFFNCIVVSDLDYVKFNQQRNLNNLTPRSSSTAGQAYAGSVLKVIPFSDPKFADAIEALLYLSLSQVGKHKSFDKYMRAIFPSLPYDPQPTSQLEKDRNAKILAYVNKVVSTLQSLNGMDKDQAIDTLKNLKSSSEEQIESLVDLEEMSEVSQ